MKIRNPRGIFSTHDSASCDCDTCAIGRGLDRMAARFDSLLNHQEELEMSFSYLRDEIQVVIGYPWWRPKRKRLIEALRVAKFPATPTNTRTEQQNEPDLLL